MLSNQLIKKTLIKANEISGLNMLLVTARGDVIFRNSDELNVNEGDIEKFLSESTSFAVYQGKLFFKIKSGNFNEYILALENSGHEAEIVGKMLVLQLEELIEAYKEQYDKDKFFKALLMDNMLAVDIFERAKRLHIDINKFYCVILVREKESIGENVISHVGKTIKGNADDYVTAIDNNDVIIIKSLADGDSLDKLYAISKAIQEDFPEQLSISYGTIVKDLVDVSRSYKEAMIAMDVSNIFFEGRGINPYSNLDIGRLIYQLPIPLCRIFLKEVFGDINPADFDEETKQTINTFFDKSLNVSETSRQLFIHRNTLVYRIDKIQRITGLDLRIFEDAVTFKIAMMVSKYLDYLAKKDRI